MPLIHRTLSPRALEARQLNARRSTGPRTALGKEQAALNLLLCAAYSRRFARSLRALGESPKDYRRLLAGLVESYQPATPSEATLVDELATLHWQRRRCERAQAALLAQSLAGARQEELRRTLERRRRPWSIPDPAPGCGVRFAPDSLSKFSQLSELMARLEDCLAEGNLTEQTQAMLQRVYGDHPVGRGAHIMKLYEHIAQPGPETPLRQATLHGLQLAILEDANDAMLEQEAYRSICDEPPSPTRDACLAPSGEAWSHLMRQQISIDRQIERKIKLLIEMQDHRRAQQTLPPGRPRKRHAEK